MYFLSILYTYNLIASWLPLQNHGKNYERDSIYIKYYVRDQSLPGDQPAGQDCYRFQE
jgi:hypothetical protein